LSSMSSELKARSSPRVTNVIIHTDNKLLARAEMQNVEVTLRGRETA
jgi:hypothetical protein